MATILIVDDEVPSLAMLRLFLEAIGYKVLAAENEAAGIDIFTTEKPSIVITDIKMPGKDGLLLLKKIKATVPETQVIVITGHGDRDLEKQALDSGAAHFLHKPLDPVALKQALQQAQQHVQSF
ncbi:MAG: response regulator [Desulfobacteraceae bacterium]|nr:response regulator [Desulfobacteraceae bacterium]